MGRWQACEINHPRQTPLKDEIMKRKRTKIDPHIELLYKAVQNYVEQNGGKLVVIGGITVQEWPQDNKGIFHVAVKCLGRMPKFAEPTLKEVQLKS